MIANFLFEWKRLWKSGRILLLLVVAAGLSVALFVRTSGRAMDLIDYVNEKFIPVSTALLEEEMHYLSWYEILDLEDEEINERLSTQRELGASVIAVLDAGHENRRDELPALLYTLYTNYGRYWNDGKLDLQRVVKEEEKKGSGMDDIDVLEIGGPTVDLLLNEWESQKDLYGQMQAVGASFELPSASLSGANFSMEALHTFFGWAGLLPLLFLLLPVWTEDAERGERLSRRATPARMAEGLAKQLAALCAAVVFYGAIFLFSYGLAAYFGDGTGTFSYPILLGPQVDWLQDPPAPFYRLISLRAYMGSAVILYLSFVFFVLGLVHGITVLVKNRLRSLLLIGLLLFVGLFLSKNSALLRYADSMSAFSAFPFYQPFALFYVEAFLQSLSVPVFVPVLLLLSYGLLLCLAARLLEKRGRTLPQTRRTKQTGSFLAKWEKGAKSAFPVLTLERKKLWGHADTKLALFLCIALPLGVIAYGRSQYDQAIHSALELYTLTVSQMEEELANPTSHDLLYIKHLENLRDADKAAIEAYTARDPVKMADKMRNHWADISHVRQTGYANKLSNETIQINEAYLQELQKTNSLPGLSPHMWEPHSPFDLFSEPGYMQRSALLGKQSHGALSPMWYDGVQMQLPLFLLGVILFGICKGYTEEFANNKPFYLMRGQPVSALRLFLGKWTLQITAASMLLLLAFFLPRLLPKVGVLPMDAEYPVVEYTVTPEEDKGAMFRSFPAKNLAVHRAEKEESEATQKIPTENVRIAFRPAEEGNRKSLLFYMAALFTLGSLMFMVSVVWQKDWGVFLVVLLIGAVLYGASTWLSPALGIAWPFELLNTGAALSGEAYLEALIPYAPTQFYTKIGMWFLYGLLVVAGAYAALRARMIKGNETGRNL